MKFYLKRPCDNCPFADQPGRITFQCRERASEIENLAYRRGFVCHEHAECIEDDEDYLGNGGGFDFRADGTSQHCWGALAMYVKDGGSSVPWERACDADPDLEERWWSRADKKALAIVFDDYEAFLAANENRAAEGS